VQRQFDCTSCQLGKQLAFPFNNSELLSTGIFDLIHPNVWGPSLVTSIGGFRYFVVFIDDHSRYSWIFLIKNLILNYYKSIVNLQKWLKHNFPNVSRFFDMIMFLNTLNMLFKQFFIPLALYIT